MSEMLHLNFKFNVKDFFFNAKYFLNILKAKFNFFKSLGIYLSHSQSKKRMSNWTKLKKKHFNKLTLLRTF